MKHILDPEFRYRPSYATNVRETFERVRREQQSHEPQIGASTALNSPLAVLPDSTLVPFTWD